MKLIPVLFLVIFIAVVDSSHLFFGTNVDRPLLYHHKAEYGGKVFKKRIENLQYEMPDIPSNFGRSIQGILIYDLTHSDASANVTIGGVGSNFVNIRMKSERGKKLNYDIYIYS